MQKFEPKRYTTSTPANTPEKRITAGAVSVTIWRNESKKKDGTSGDYSTISLQRSYQDAKGQWQHTATLRVNDLPKAALALSKAYEYLVFKGEQAEQ